MGLGAASVKAQVRIGGNGAPNAAAVLDLNANDDATPAANKGALALPRVSLASTTAQLNGATPVTGMLVYNTNASMTGGSGVGMYYWDGATWVMLQTSLPSGNLATLHLWLDTVISVPPITLGTTLDASQNVYLHEESLCLGTTNPVFHFGIGSNHRLRIYTFGNVTTTTTVRVKCYSWVAIN